MPRALVVGANDATVAALDELMDVVRVEEPGGALARATETDADAIVAGPDVDGLALLRHVGERVPATPRVLLAEDVDGTTLNRARDDGIEVVVLGPDGAGAEGAAERVRRIAAERAVERERRGWEDNRRVACEAIRAAASAGSPATVAERVCTTLVDGNGYRIACLVDGPEGERTPRAVAGIDPDALDLSAFPAPDGESVQTRETDAVGGIQTVATVPLGDDGALYLAASRSIGRDERRRLAGLGSVVGRLLAASGTDDTTEFDWRGAPDSVATLGDALAHELGNDVQAALLRVEGLQGTDALSGDGTALDDADRALDDIGRALDRIGRIADLARVLGSGTVTDRSVVDVAERARATWETVDAAEEASLETAGDCRIRAQESLLDLLLENLLRNAVTHAGPSVTVTVGPLDDGFFVEDDGPGFPEEDRDRVLDWGYTTGDGSGLGLAIVRRIADAHGWSVSLERSATGGARIAVRGVTRVADG